MPTCKGQIKYNINKFFADKIIIFYKFTFKIELRIYLILLICSRFIDTSGIVHWLQLGFLLYDLGC